MLDARLNNAIKSCRKQLGLSQQALADRVGVSRQAIVAIEAGRQVPATNLALLLARSLGCSVDDLFSLASPEGLEVRLAPSGASSVAPPAPARVVLGEVAGRWVAHRIALDARVAADAILEGADATAPTAIVEPLSDLDVLTRNVLVAGCAPLLGALSQRVAGRFHDARVSWLPATSRRALDLLRDGFVHVAGVHLSDAESRDDNAATVQRMFPGERMVIVNLTRWRQGFIVPEGNPLSIRAAADLLRPGLRFVGREKGAGAEKLVSRLLANEGAGAHQASLVARGHEDVARFVQCGAADVGVAIESVALAAGLDFVPVAEERFDLVMPAAFTQHTPVRRLLEALDDRAFRVELDHLPGYDGELSGHVTTLEAA